MRLLFVAILLIFNWLKGTHCGCLTGQHTQGCGLQDRTLEYSLTSSCTVTLGTQKVCENNSPSSCSSHTHPHFKDNGATPPVLQTASHCRVDGTTIQSGTLSVADIQAHEGCSSYDGNPLHYKYADANNCKCCKPAPPLQVTPT